MIGALLRIRYELTHELGEDPVFAAYRARDRVSGRDVRIRVLKDPYRVETAFVERLARVVDKLKALNHPSVERVYDLEEDNGLWFVVSEGCFEPSLEDRLKRLSSLSAPVALSTAISICEGLEAIHRAGLVHGDLSARNVFAASNGAVKLSLTGVWESYAHSASAGAVMLSVMAPYLAPEVTSGAMPTESSDVYALGVLLYQMLAGHFPFSGDTPVAIAVKHATAPCPSLRALNPSVPVVLDEIVRKAMSKTMDQRYSNASSMMRDLRTLQDALRFGRSLTWPLRPTANPQEPVQVAPRMSAVRPDPKESRQRAAKQSSRDDSDRLPWWFVAFASVFVLALLCAVGAWAYVNLNKPKQITVPNIVGMTENEAITHLRTMNLKLRVQKREATDKVAEGTIISVSPAPNQEVKEWSFVDAVVSSGSQFVVLPDFRGKSLSEARTVIKDLGLVLVEPVKEIRDRDLAPGLISSQSPEPRMKADKGSQVRLKVSAGSNSASEPTASEGEYVYSLRFQIPTTEDTRYVRVEMTDDDGTRTIHEEQHEPGDWIDLKERGKGTEATFRIFFDGELKRQVTKKAPARTTGAPSSTRNPGRRTRRGAGTPPATPDAVPPSEGPGL